MGLFILYWLIVIVLFLIGLGISIFAKDNEKRKTGIRMLITSVIMLIIGAGVCGYILMNLNLGNMH
ncbi:hypothetical protein GCM10010992_12130 [Cloacibacterium rupense]|uniref:Uncharacterized protein n=1 Tax=Cloacibacterium rupense TaxID=517423 RepID=A0ABQ2NKB8_9FLAO|nr:hypothetical protein [Cloacibacterium rupense]GGP03497.1 hypothetical protein GCM10010992_12130 [Cloacibacterium rupense]